MKVAIRSIFSTNGTSTKQMHSIHLRSDHFIRNLSKVKSGPVSLKIPQGDTKERLVCDSCGFINYVNPKIVVGAVVSHKYQFLEASNVRDMILLCKRAIQPQEGYWTLPGARSLDSAEQ
jgi:hypothetical protein